MVPTCPAKARSRTGTPSSSFPTPQRSSRRSRAGQESPDINARGILARLEAVDALETHFQETRQELAGANAARDELLHQLGFTNVVFFEDLPNKVESAQHQPTRNDSKRQGRRRDRSIAAGQAKAVLDLHTEVIKGVHVALLLTVR